MDSPDEHVFVEGIGSLYAPLVTRRILTVPMSLEDTPHDTRRTASLHRESLTLYRGAPSSDAPQECCAAAIPARRIDVKRTGSRNSRVSPDEVTMPTKGGGLCTYPPPSHCRSRHESSRVASAWHKAARATPSCPIRMRNVVPHAILPTFLREIIIIRPSPPI